VQYKDDYFQRKSFEGEWHADKRHGYGVLSFSHDGVYRGEWADDVYHGKGELVSVQACARDRSCVRRSSRTQVFPDGDVFYGEFANGKLRRGKLESRQPGSECVYQGGFVDERKHGQGKETLPDGTTYEGEFNQGRRVGRGRLTLPDGEWFEGLFDGETKIDGTWTHQFPNGDLCVLHRAARSPLLLASLTRAASLAATSVRCRTASALAAADCSTRMATCTKARGRRTAWRARARSPCASTARAAASTRPRSCAACGATASSQARVSALAGVRGVCARARTHVYD
jgi:hypothetical protein